MLVGGVLTPTVVRASAMLLTLYLNHCVLCFTSLVGCVICCVCSTRGVCTVCVSYARLHVLAWDKFQSVVAHTHTNPSTPKTNSLRHTQRSRGCKSQFRISRHGWLPLSPASFPFSPLCFKGMCLCDVSVGEFMFFFSCDCVGVRLWMKFRCGRVGGFRVVTLADMRAAFAVWGRILWHKLERMDERKLARKLYFCRKKCLLFFISRNFCAR